MWKYLVGSAFLGAALCPCPVEAQQVAIQPCQTQAVHVPAARLYHHVVECKVGNLISLICASGATPAIAKSNANQACAAQTGTVIKSYGASSSDPSCGAPPPPFFGPQQPGVPQAATRAENIVGENVWAVYACVRCRNGAVEMARGTGANYCEAYREAICVARDIASFNCGARCYWVVEYQRPTQCCGGS